MELLAVVVQVDGEVAAHAGGVDLPEVGVVEEGLVVELVLQGGVGVNGILRTPPGHAGPQLHRVLGVDAVGDPVEVAQEEPGLAGVDGPDDAVSAVDEADGVLHGAQLALVDLLVGHALVFVAEVLLVLSVLFQHHIGDVPVIVFVVFVHERRLLFWMNSGKQGQTICFYDSKKGDGGATNRRGKVSVIRQGRGSVGKSKAPSSGMGEGAGDYGVKEIPVGSR